MSGPPNLIPLQLDQTTGNLVAKTLSGTYVPPSGTGFQYVTGGVPTLTAVTPTQATALLNLFTASLQGLVPASGGGTVNFLRADGTWTAPPGASGVLSFNTRTGAVTLTSADVNAALGYTAYDGVTNPAGFLVTAVTSVTAGAGISVSAPTGPVTIGNTGVLSFNTRTGAVTLTSGDVTTALGFTPYNATNPSGYISGNQNITLSGDVSGSGTTAITVTLPTIATAGTFKSVTVNAKGQVTAGTNPTTLAGFGITDGVSSQVSTTLASAVSLTFQGGGTVHGIPTPVVSTDVANKAYVDAVAQGLSWKTATKAATTVNLVGSYIGTPTFTLTASPAAVLPTIDGYAATVGDRILVKNQSTQSQNGIYVVTQTTSPWILTRATDFNETTPIDEVNGAAVYVELGSTQSNTIWTQIDYVVVFDTDPIAWTVISSGTGTVTSVAVSGSNGIGVGGSPIVTSGTITLSLGAITPSSVASVGTVTGSNLAGTNTGDQTITLTGDVTGSGTGTFATTLANTAVSPGSYTNASLTVDSKGRLTAASSGTSPVTAVSGTAGNISSTGGLTPTIDLVTTAVTPGSYTNTSLTVDAYGRITTASSGSGGGTVTSVTVNGTAGNISSSGSPITASGTITLNLIDTTVSPGSYTNASLTVDSKGRLTAASSGTIPSRTEVVVWRYTDIGATNINATVVSTTSGIATATASGTATTYTFTGYTTPPVSSVVYAQTITGPSAFSWNVNPSMASIIGITMTDTGTPSSPGLISTFSSTPVMTFTDCSGGSLGASSNQPGVFPYLVVVFKF